MKTVEADYWCYAYHHVNGFEDVDGKIVFDTCTWDKVRPRISQILTLFYLSAGDCCPYIAIYKTDTFLLQKKFTLYFTDICSPNGKDNYPRMKLSRFLIDIDEGTATHHCLSDLPCELPSTSWDYTGKPYQHMYLSSAVGTNEAGVNGPMQALTKG